MNMFMNSEHVFFFRILLGFIQAVTVDCLLLTETFYGVVPV